MAAIQPTCSRASFQNAVYKLGETTEHLVAARIFWAEENDGRVFHYSVVTPKELGGSQIARLPRYLDGIYDKVKHCKVKLSDLKVDVLTERNEYLVLLGDHCGLQNLSCLPKELEPYKGAPLAKKKANLFEDNIFNFFSTTIANHTFVAAKLQWTVGELQLENTITTDNHKLRKTLQIAPIINSTYQCMKQMFRRTSIRLKAEVLSISKARIASIQVLEYNSSKDIRGMVTGFNAGTSKYYRSLNPHLDAALKKAEKQ